MKATEPSACQQLFTIPDKLGHVLKSGVDSGGGKRITACTGLLQQDVRHTELQYLRRIVQARLQWKQCPRGVRHVIYPHRHALDTNASSQRISKEAGEISRPQTHLMKATPHAAAGAEASHRSGARRHKCVSAAARRNPDCELRATITRTGGPRVWTRKCFPPVRALLKSGRIHASRHTKWNWAVVLEVLLDIQALL